MEPFLHELPFISDLEQPYADGNCGALIWSEATIPRTKELQEFMCNREFMRTQFLFSILWTQPVHQPHVAGIVDAWIVFIRNRDGLTYQNFESSYYVSVCAAFTSSFAPTSTTASGVSRRRLAKSAATASSVASGALSTGSSDLQPMTLSNFVGPLALLIFAVVLSISIRVVIGLPNKNLINVVAAENTAVNTALLELSAIVPRLLSKECDDTHTASTPQDSSSHPVAKFEGENAREGTASDDTPITRAQLQQLLDEQMRTLRRELSHSAWL